MDDGLLDICIQQQQQKQPNNKHIYRRVYVYRVYIYIYADSIALCCAVKDAK